MTVNLTFDSGEQSVGGPRYMQTIATLQDTDLKIQTHLASNIALTGFHGLATVMLSDPASRVIYVSQPYLDGVNGRWQAPRGRWVEHHETVPDYVANNTDRIDILQCWHGVNMLARDLQIFWDDFKPLILAIAASLFGGGASAGQQPVSDDSAVSQLNQQMTSSSGHSPLHTQISGLWHAPTTGVITGVPYYLTNKHSGKCLEIGGSRMEDGAGGNQWDWVGGKNQQWTFTDVGGAAYRLTVAHSGKCLDVWGESKDNGARVYQWTWWGGDNEKWQLAPQPDGSFEVRAVHSGRCLEIGGGRTENGAGTNQWEWFELDHQKWYLHRVVDPLHR
jgi:Ricin-type beta-trefoil lectin domain-like